MLGNGEVAIYSYSLFPFHMVHIFIISIILKLTTWLDRDRISDTVDT